ncbi:MAG: formate dehydrogenase accessory sulfurtransferase FdhD [Candidatus Bathyarchaeia archaeon]
MKKAQPSTGAISETIKVRLTKINVRLRAAEVSEEEVAIEAPVNLYANEEHVATLMATPSLLKELALGYFVDEGLVRDLRDIHDVSIDGNDVRVTVKPEIRLRIQVARTTRLITTACGSIEDFLRLLDRLDKPHVESTYTVTAERIVKMAYELNQRAQLYRKTGGLHSAALYTERGLAAFAEDVGRHNAVDKVVGGALSLDVDFSTSVLVTSGRQPADMVLKAARAGIPITVSTSGPIYSGILAAQKTNVTLVCFARGQRMNVYTSPERIVLSASMLTSQA